MKDREEYISILEQDNAELKKELEEKEKKYIPGEYAKEEYIKEFNENILLKKQQQEFIKYLEDMLDDDNDIFSVIRVKDVLQKYKEIIGCDKE